MKKKKKKTATLESDAESDAEDENQQPSPKQGGGGEHHLQKRRGRVAQSRRPNQLRARWMLSQLLSMQKESPSRSRVCRWRGRCPALEECARRVLQGRVNESCCKCECKCKCKDECGC